MGIRINLFALERSRLEPLLQEYPGASDNSYGLAKWFEAQSLIASSGIRLISQGYRRWWFGPVLDKIRATWSFNKDEYECARTIFAKILQGLNCGTDDKYFSASKHRGPAFLTPYSDSDLRIGFLDTNDVDLVLTLFGELIQLEDYQFQRPEKTMGIVPDTDEWDDWVKCRIAEILSIQELKYEQPCVVSFIG